MADDDDWRSVGQVMADADRKLAEALGERTGTKLEPWFALLQRGKPFREVEALAKAHVRQRVQAFKDRKP